MDEKLPAITRKEMGMAKRERAEYFRQYYPTRKLREAVRAKLAVDPVCHVCNWQFATVYWGPRAIYSCEDCAAKLSEWDRTWRPKAEAAAKAKHDLWAGPKVVHIFDKGQWDAWGVWGVWGELGELADIPAVQAICGILSPPGPVMLDMLQPKELKKCPLCPACLQAYAEPPGLTPLENKYFGYAIPTTAAAAPAPDPALETDAPVEPLIPAR